MLQIANHPHLRPDAQEHMLRFSFVQGVASHSSSFTNPDVLKRSEVDTISWPISADCREFIYDVG